MKIRDISTGEMHDMDSLPDGRYHVRVGGFSSPCPRILHDVTKPEIMKNYILGQDCFVERIERR